MVKTQDIEGESNMGTVLQKIRSTSEMQHPGHARGAMKTLVEIADRARIRMRCVQGRYSQTKDEEQAEARKMLIEVVIERQDAEIFEQAIDTGDVKDQYANLEFADYLWQLREEQKKET